MLTPLETLAQSIAGIAPSATPGLLIPIVFGFAGNGTWLAYLLATVGMLFTAQCINEFASRSACPGSLYTFVLEGFGQRAGMLTGWAMLFAYVVCGGACITEFALYADSLAKHYLHINLNSAAMMSISAAIVAYAAYKNIKLSANVMLYLEFISIVLILVIAGLTIASGVQHSSAIDAAQLTLQGVSIENVRQGLVMAIFSFVAFESAASLGDEAKDPLRTIPQAIIRSVLFSGAFFAVCAYATILAFHQQNDGGLAKCATPLLQMAQWLHMTELGHLIDAGIMMSFFAAALANLNAGSRAMYKMSQNGIFHAKLSDTHQANQTPHIAVGITTGTSLGIALSLAAFGCPLLDIVGWLGTLATFGFIYAYMATSISAARLLKARNTLTPAKQAVITISMSVLLLALVGSLYPSPSFPYNILPAIFIVYMSGAGINTYTTTKGASSEAPSAVTLSATSKHQS